MPKRNLKGRAHPDGPKRAGIYIRVSSERQAEGVSPQTQEQDCVEYAKSRGYAVVEVYRDIERYRVGARTVEPSGVRSDRPGLKRMLKDAYDGKLDVMIAWREDRLYRSYRPMLDVLDCIDETGIDVELVKEHFDKTIAPVKAWAARMELNAKHDRFMMGVAGRLAKGKVSNVRTPLGYQIVDGAFVVVPEEAKWVKQIWKWYAAGVTVWEIRKRLIAAGAPQRMKKHKHPWALDTLYSLVDQDHDYYVTGIFKETWNGEVFEFSAPVLIGAEIALKVRERQRKYKAWPAGNSKIEALAAGLIYCQACHANMRAFNAATRRNGEKRWYGYYACRNRHNGNYVPGCATMVRTNRIDREVWGKVWDLIAKPGKFMAAIDKRIAQLEAQQTDAVVELGNLEDQLADVLAERQRVINWALKGKITDDDMDLQLKRLDSQRDELERDLAEQRLLTDHRVDRLKELAEIYRANVLAGAENINAEPETPEEASLQFQARRKIVERLVIRIEVKADKSTEVFSEIDFAGLRINRTATYSEPIDTQADYRLTLTL